MKTGELNKMIFSKQVVISFLCGLVCTGLCGCSFLSGYSNDSLFSKDIEKIYLKIFNNDSFRRGVEYELSDALAKRIEAQTPYKVVSSQDRADACLSGRITAVDTSVLSIDKNVGRALEKEVRVSAVVKLENLKTGAMLLDNVPVSATATFSEWQNQSFDYAATLAANRLAVKITALMEKKW